MEKKCYKSFASLKKSDKIYHGIIKRDALYRPRVEVEEYTVTANPAVFHKDGIDVQGKDEKRLGYSKCLLFDGVEDLNSSIWEGYAGESCYVTTMEEMDEYFKPIFKGYENK